MNCNQTVVAAVVAVVVVAAVVKRFADSIPVTVYDQRKDQLRSIDSTSPCCNSFGAAAAAAVVVVVVAAAVDVAGAVPDSS